jgi:hypothetical protein
MSKLFPDTAGNRIYLACPCGLNPFELARRKKSEFEAAKMLNLLDGWFDAHAKCPNGPDRFKLAYNFQCNYDQPKLADPVENAVRLALVKA